MHQKIVSYFIVVVSILSPFHVLAQTDFNPHFIISDPELEDYQSWTRHDIQQFLISHGSYLKNYAAENVSGTIKMAPDIIYDAAQRYKINPKFLLVTLQKEQSLITDDTPAEKQLNWATGYAVCDSCNLEDPKILKFKGFGKQVDNAAGIMRWYYDNRDKDFIKKKDLATTIDNQLISPQSWATAFLYTYTPHIHGNQNFWRIWNTWFEQVYPNGTLIVSASSTEYWLIDNGQRRKFKNKTTLITRTDPKTAVTMSEVDLSNYKIGAEISFPNYSLLHTTDKTFLLDHDTLRPFASEALIGKLGFNPQELIDVDEFELAGLTIGSTITATSTAPQGVVYYIPEIKSYYFLKDNILYPIVDKAILTSAYKNVPIENHKLKDLAKFETAERLAMFNDGTLLKDKENQTIYVMDQGKKRPIADDDTFIALGYNSSNITTAAHLTLANIPTGETIFLNASLLSSRNKYLGDSRAEIPDIYTKNNLSAYLVAEYPSSRIISGKNIDSRQPIASLTKILTVNEVLNNNVSLDQTTIYNPKLHATYSNPLRFQTGDKLKNKDLLNAMMVVSNNTASRMLALTTKMDETTFVEKINKRLEEWGADNTTIADVTGLDENNKSTARDLLKIFTKVLNNDTIRVALGQATYPFSKTSAKNKTEKWTLHNTNQIIFKIPFAKRHYKVVATKTGYTDEAKATLLMLIEDKVTKKQYIVVTLGNPDYTKRFQEPHKIAEWITTSKVSVAGN